jgi:hypothetical protein
MPKNIGKENGEKTVFSLKKGYILNQMVPEILQALMVGFL